MEVVDVIEVLKSREAKARRAKKEGKYVLTGKQDSRLYQLYSALASEILEWGGEEEPGLPGKSLVIASPTPRDGRTLTAVNLATAAAGLGARVLLVDADLIGPVICPLLNIPAQEGLVESVLEERNPVELIIEIPDRGFHFLNSGSVKGINPIGVVTGKRILEVLQKMRDSYDLVVIDTAPLILHAYVMTLIKAAHDVLGVVRAEWTKRHHVSRFLEYVRTAEGELAGTVFNDFRLVIPLSILRWL